MKSGYTFEEEKLREDTYVLFNGVFTAGVVGLILLVFVFFAADAVENVFDPSTRFALRITLVPFLKGLSVLVPFLVYNHRQNRPLINREKDKTKLSPLLVCIVSVATIGSALSARFVSGIIKNALEAGGYVITGGETLAGEGALQNVLYIIVPSLITSLFYTVAFDMIAVDKLSRINAGAALVIPALICAFASNALEMFPYVFIIELFAAYIYMKTTSAISAFIVRFVSLGSVAAYILFDFPIWAVAGAFVVAIVAIIVTLKKFGKVELKQMLYAEEGQQLSAKDTIFGVARASIFWIFVIGAVAIYLFECLSDPDFIARGMEDATSVVPLLTLL